MKYSKSIKILFLTIISVFFTALVSADYPSSCSNITNPGGKSCHSITKVCTAPPPSYCGRNVTFTARAGGSLYVLGNIVDVYNGQTHNGVQPGVLRTDIQIAAGQQIIVQPSNWGAGWTSGYVSHTIGEYPWSGPSLQGEIDSITSQGMTVIEVLGYTDDFNDTASYDFNDGWVIVAVQEDPPPPDCNYGNPYFDSSTPNQTYSGDITMSANPYPAVRGGLVALRATPNWSSLPSDKYYNFAFESATLVQAGVLQNNCSNNASCTTTVIGNAGRYVWHAKYHYTNKTNSFRRTCEKSSVFEVIDPPGYLLTQDGDTFIQSGFNMPTFVKYANSSNPAAAIYPKCISEYLYSYSTTPNSITGRCSTNGYLKTLPAQYKDQNDGYLDYEKLKTAILDRAKEFEDVKVTNPATTPSLNLTIDPAKPLEKNIFVFNGSKTISSSNLCDTRAIYFINGDLTINPPFTTKRYLEDYSKTRGCLFIINGNLTINGGTDLADNAFDLIHGFFILTGPNSEFIVPEDEFDRLKIIGGLVMKNNANIDQIHRKSLGFTTPSLYFPPSEIIIYEGARYISLFGDLLTDSGALFNINETPFINTFTN